MSRCLPNTHALLNIRRGDTISEADNELCNLFYVDDILVLFVCAFLALNSAKRVDGLSGSGKVGIHGNNLGTTSNLEGMLLLHALSICRDVPEVWGSETSVGFFDA